MPPTATPAPPICSPSSSTAPKPRLPHLNGHDLHPPDSTDVLVGSSIERKVKEQDPNRVKPDTTNRLQELRRLMIREKLDY